MDMTKEQLKQHEAALREQYQAYQQQGLQLDMSRGKPGAEQLDLTLDMFDCVNAREGYAAANVLVARHYGVLDGLSEM